MALRWPICSCAHHFQFNQDSAHGWDKSYQRGYLHRPGVILLAAEAFRMAASHKASASTHKATLVVAFAFMAKHIAFTYAVG
jgi:hypothetical protein